MLEVQEAAQITGETTKEDVQIMVGAVKEEEVNILITEVGKTTEILEKMMMILTMMLNQMKKNRHIM